MQNTISNRQKVFKGLTSQTIITIVLGALELAYFAIMSRLLSADDFGYFAVVMAVTAVLNSLSEAGFGSAVIQKKNASSDYVSTAFSLSLIVGAILAFFLFLTARLFSILVVSNDSLTLAFRMVSITVFLTSLISIGRAMFMRRLDFFKFGFYQILSYILSSFIGICMARSDYGLYSILTAIVVNQLVMTFILYIYSSFSPKFKLINAYVREIFAYGGWMTGSVIVRNITQQMDSLMMSHWLPVSLLGTFNRPSGFVTRISDQINGIFDTILFPILSGIQDDRQKMKTAYCKSVVLILSFSLLLVYCMILSSTYIIDIFFGDKWEHINYLLQFIVLSVLFLGYNRIADCFFRSIGIVKIYFFIRIASFIVTTVCVFIGCQYGLWGVACALLASRMIDSVIKFCVLDFYLKVDKIELLKKTLSCVTVMTIAFIMAYVLFLEIPIFRYLSIISFVLFLFTAAIFSPKSFGNELQVYLIKIRSFLVRKNK